MEQNNYTVIIGDICGSRQLPGDRRYQTQLFIKSAIIQINEQFRDVIEAPLTITKGDEFQALLPDIYQAQKIIFYLEKITIPIQLRFGIGEGEVYKMGGKLPIEMDGPAFHKANEALKIAKRKKFYYYLVSDERREDVLVNAIFKLLTGIKSRWSERHYRFYWHYKEMGTYKEVATLENITPQTVCDTLKNIRALEVKFAEESLLEYFAGVVARKLTQSTSSMQT